VAKRLAKNSPQFSGHICCGQMTGWIKTPITSATHTVRGPPRTSQRDVVNCPGGAASRRHGYDKHHFPPGTAGVRSLPLAATAAREAHLHVAPTARPRVSWPHTLQTAVDRAAAWSSHSRNLQVTLWIKSTTHAGTRLPKKKSFVKIKCINCCSSRSTALT